MKHLGTVRFLAPFLLVLGASRVAEACSQAHAPDTIPSSYGAPASLPLNAPAVGVTTRANGLLLVGPLNGAARSASTPVRVLWTRPTDATARLPAVEGAGMENQYGGSYFVIPVSGLVVGDYLLEVLLPGDDKATNALNITPQAALPSGNGLVLQMPAGALEFTPRRSDDNRSSCGAASYPAYHSASGTAPLPADLLPWQSVIYGGEFLAADNGRLNLFARAAGSGLELSTSRTYTCPHPKGVRTLEGSLRLFGAGQIASVRASDDVPECDSDSDWGCSAAPETGNYVWSAPVVVALALLGRRRSAAARRS